MKKTVFLILALVLCLSLVACNSSNVEADSGGNVGIQKQENDVPSNDLLRKDLEEALRTKNEYAAVIDYETIKSLTGDGSYEITLNVYAETKYADWTYAIDMDYRKYDQGWMIDDVSWVSGSYEQVRIPDADTMQTYSKEYLMSRVDYYDEYFLSVENGAVNLEIDADAGSNMLVYTWDAVVDYDFFAILHHITSWWEYNSEIDNWELLPDNSTGSLGYCIFSSRQRIPSKNLDLTGTWYARDVQGNIAQGEQYAKFVFSNFSWEEFDIQVSGFIDTPEHFTIAVINPFNENICDWVFINKDGEYILFDILDGYGIAIYYSSDSSMPEKGLVITKEFLPIS